VFSLQAQSVAFCLLSIMGIQPRLRIRGKLAFYDMECGGFPPLGAHTDRRFPNGGLPPFTTQGLYAPPAGGKPPAVKSGGPYAPPKGETRRTPYYNKRALPYLCQYQAQTLYYPEGVFSYSPGLRVSALPRGWTRIEYQPQRGCLINGAVWDTRQPPWG